MINLGDTYYESDDFLEAKTTVGGRFWNTAKGEVEVDEVTARIESTLEGTGYKLSKIKCSAYLMRGYQGLTDVIATTDFEKTRWDKHLHPCEAVERLKEFIEANWGDIHRNTKKRLSKDGYGMLSAHYTIWLIPADTQQPRRIVIEDEDKYCFW